MYLCTVLNSSIAFGKMMYRVVSCVYARKRIRVTVLIYLGIVLYVMNILNANCLFKIGKQGFISVSPYQRFGLKELGAC